MSFLGAYVILNTDHIVESSDGQRPFLEQVLTVMGIEDIQNCAYTWLGRCGQIANRQMTMMMMMLLLSLCTDAALCWHALICLS